MSKSHRSLCVSFCRIEAGLRIYHLFVWSNLNFLHITQWITLPTQSCLVLYSICANLLHLHIMRLTVSSLSSHHYYYYYYYFTPLRDFNTSDAWWFFIWVWVTASLLKSLWFISVCGPILTLLFLITWRRPEVKFGRNVVKKKQQQKKATKMRTKYLQWIQN